MKDEKENEFIYDNYFDDTDDYDQMYKFNPPWLSSLFIITFGALMRWGSQIIQFVKTFL